MTGKVASLEKLHEMQKKQSHWGWVDGMYVAGNDCGVGLRLLNGVKYEETSRRLWRKLCSVANIAVDVGAHNGIYSLDAWKAGAVDVLSIEPYHMNYARLVMNLRHAGYRSDTAIFCAASDSKGIAWIRNNNGSDFNYYCASGACIVDVAIDGGPHDIFPVRKITLDELIGEESHGSIGVVKIDVERHCVEVLKGMRRILKHKPDIIFECTEDGIGDVLSSYGYDFYRIEEGAGILKVDSPLKDDPMIMESLNRYATVKSEDTVRELWRTA